MNDLLRMKELKFEILDTLAWKPSFDDVKWGEDDITAPIWDGSVSLKLPMRRAIQIMVPLLERCQS